MYTGLDEKEVAAARRQFGDNSLTRRGRQSLWRQFLAGFGDPIIKILLVALAINVVFLFRTADWYETAGIAAAVFIATAVSALSEYGSETAFQKLQSDAAGISCRIKRKDGVHLLPIDEAVVGDIVLLQAGERVPADGILLSGSLTVDQAALTGEATEVNKTPTEKESSIRDLLAANRLFRGTVVTDGNGVMQVERVGDGTFYGGLAQELQEETRESPLRLRLTQLAKVLSRIGYVAAGLVGLADLLHIFWIETGGSLQSILPLITNPETLIASLLHAATLAITVVVVAVPEGLPMMITVVLSANMRRMLRDHVLVRRLFGIETAGNLNLLFTDKTGTLTRGKPTVFCAVTGDGKRHERRESLRGARGFWQWMELSCATNSDSVTADGAPVGGNATDRALLQYVLPLTGSAAAVKRTPFDSEKKYAAAALADGRVLVKGAPEKLLPACTRCVDTAGQLRPFTAKHTVETQLKDMTENAMRVIALIVTFGGNAAPPFADAALVALIGISDPVRRTAAAAVREMTRAGIQTVMITGDNRETAVAIAKAAGILPKEPQREAVITASELALLTDGELKRRLPSLRVVARALPSDKSRLVRVAQEAGADLLINQCSSVSEVADIYAKELDIPVLKIDQPMAEKAVAMGKKIALVTTNTTTVGPSRRLLERCAKAAGKEIEVVECVVDGAMEVLFAGDVKKHNDMLRGMIESQDGKVDVIVLAQGSMIAIMPEITHVKTPVLTSIPLGVERAVEMIHQMEKED